MHNPIEKKYLLYRIDPKTGARIFIVKNDQFELFDSLEDINVLADTLDDLAFESTSRGGRQFYSVQVKDKMVPYFYFNESVLQFCQLPKEAAQCYANVGIDKLSFEDWQHHTVCLKKKDGQSTLETPMLGDVRDALLAFYKKQRTKAQQVEDETAQSGCDCLRWLTHLFSCPKHPASPESMEMEEVTGRASPSSAAASSLLLMKGPLHV